jgi:hypothetical protein
MAKTFTSGEVLTASDVNVNLATHMPMIPTSVAGSGVAYNTTTGLVTLTAASSASLNGVFNSTYSRYDISFDFPTTSSNLTFNCRLRASGTDNSSAVYDNQSLRSTGAASGTVVGENTLAGTSFLMGSTTATRLHVGLITLYRPGSASPTMMESRAFATLNPATAAASTQMALRSGLHRDSTAFDGLTFTFISGTATGTIKVFAYN